MKEYWVDVVEFESLYKVSNLGRIKRILKVTSTFAGRILNPDVGKSGYHRITLFKNGVRYRKPVHVIVCVAFNGPKPPKHEVNHIDEVKGNNAAKNLEWKTPQQNKLHSFLRSGKKCYFPRKKYIFISPAGEHFEFEGLREFCTKNNLDVGAMSCVAKGEYERHKDWWCKEIK